MQAYLDILDWRRRMADLYGALARAPDLAAEWPAYVQARQDLYIHHPAGIRTQDDRGPHFFDYNPAFALSSRFEALAEGTTETLNTGQDGTLQLRAVARSCDLASALGAELTLYWMEQYGGGFFLPFKDATCGAQTYGGGRYLLDTPKSAWLGQDARGRVRLDFNFAYFPSCAHDARFVCPLSPPENQLPVAIEAGERWP